MWTARSRCVADAGLGLLEALIGGLNAELRLELLSLANAITGQVVFTPVEQIFSVRAQGLQLAFLLQLLFFARVDFGR